MTQWQTAYILQVASDDLNVGVFCVEAFEYEMSAKYLSQATVTKQNVRKWWGVYILPVNLKKKTKHCYSAYFQTVNAQLI